MIDRKIRCDRGTPTCQNCVRARKQCQGYGLRLSWPGIHDRKRAVRGHLPAVRSQANRELNHRLFINTSWWDIEFFRHITSNGTTPFPLLAQPAQPLWIHPQPGLKQTDLVHYFHNAAHLSLVTFSSKTLSIRDVLIRMALTNDKSPGRALLYALLAVASLHRSGLQSEAVQFKVSALDALATSAKAGLQDWAEAAQHIQLPSESSGEWLWYVQGAMRIIEETNLEAKSDDSGVGELLDWVYYHDSLAQFAKRHWGHSTVTRDTRPSGQCPSLANGRPGHYQRHAPAVLNLLCEACTTVLDPIDPRSREEAYKARLQGLQSRIKETSIAPPAAKIDIIETGFSTELYRMTTLIYLVRASQSPWEASSSPELDALVDQAFSVPLQMPACDHFFPLFILGCEARTDGQRATILGMIERTEKGPHVRSMKRLQAGIQSVWAHHDLHADSDVVVNYVRMMNAVISSHSTLPSYV
ncbi:uncharacterized protein E0L32_005120 [Thyridium curvatum]|uniref:Zn(2)-C6 fungal-type domain-containing protein n=1 Tax=Thyridium curvatum TaxID=1093900 RepID=A0A507AVA3_9PEZI|nr:uncharacterized protein E0L32_005120 [Thyridium curvatum]TPX14725.1 hypothetical protein E0L32_005120 [Thyridium curvatum]